MLVHPVPSLISTLTPKIVLSPSIYLLEISLFILLIPFRSGHLFGGVVPAEVPLLQLVAGVTDELRGFDRLNFVDISGACNDPRVVVRENPCVL